MSLPLLLYGILPVQPYPRIIALLFCKDNNHASHAGLALQPPIQCNSIFVSQARLNHIQIISRLQTLLELALHRMIGRNTEDAAFGAKQPPSLSEHLCLLARDPHQWALHPSEKDPLLRDPIHSSQSFPCNSVLTAHGLGPSSGRG